MHSCVIPAWKISTGGESRIHCCFSSKSEWRAGCCCCGVRFTLGDRIVVCMFPRDQCGPHLRGDSGPVQYSHLERLWAWQKEATSGLLAFKRAGRGVGTPPPCPLPHQRWPLGPLGPMVWGKRSPKMEGLWKKSKAAHDEGKRGLESMCESKRESALAIHQAQRAQSQLKTGPLRGESGCSLYRPSWLPLCTSEGQKQHLARQEGGDQGKEKLTISHLPICSRPQGESYLGMKTKV